MSIKIKISIIAICFALVAAVCIGFVFASPNETVNMKGMINYEVPKITITASPNDSNLGSTNGSGDYSIGDTINLSATRSGSNSFLAWATSTDPNTMEILSTSTSYSFELTEDSPTTYYALFNQTTSTSQTVGDLVYTFYNEAKLAEITGMDSSFQGGDYTIPSVVSTTAGAYKTYSIGQNAFQNCSNLTSVTIPDGIFQIREGTFSDCSNLEAFYGEGNSYYSIDENKALIVNGGTIIRAYAAGNAATSYSIPKGVTSIGTYAFSGCSGLTSITILEGVTSIGSYAFSSCSGLTSVTIPSSITSLDEYAFYGCTSLGSVTFEGGAQLQTIGNYCFSGCEDLSSIIIPEVVTSIGSNAFANCSSLSSITIPEGVETLGSHAFYNCTNLSTVVFAGNSQLSTLSAYVFSHCSSITSITIPKGITSIGNSAFSGCTNLGSITVPNNVVSIGAWTFSGCSVLYSVSLPSSLEAIGERTFNSCTSLTEITIPEKVTALSGYIFSGCSRLSTVNLPSGLEEISAYAFNWCSRLNSISIPGSVTIVDANAFANCSNLSKIIVGSGSSLNSSLPTNATWYKDDNRTPVKNFSGVGTYSTTQPQITVNVLPNQESLGSVTGGGSFDLGDTVTLTATPSGSDFLAWATSLTPNTMEILSISPTYSFELISDSPTTYYALFNQNFEDVTTTGGLIYTVYNEAKLATVKGTTAKTLTSATIDQFVQSQAESFRVYSIGSAFRLCRDLSSVTIPASVILIGSNAFFACSSLKTIAIPEKVISIGSSAFSGCSSLTSIVIPNSVTSIGEYAFENCEGLTSFTIPSSVTSIGENAFWGCSKLAYFYGEGNSYYTIDNNRALIVNGTTLLAYATGNTKTSYSVPGIVTSIGSSAFSGCSSLTSITLPNFLTSIGSSAFSGCSNLTSITIPEKVTSIGGSAFSGCSSLTSITIPESVTSIGSYAFDGCSGLKQITINGNISTLGSRAFSYCTSLTKLTLGADVTRLPDSLFGTNNLTELNEIVVEAGPSLSAALPTYAKWYKDDDPTAVENFRGAGTYSTTQPSLSVTIAANNDGLGSISGGGSYDIGDTVELTATPSGSNKFLAWATSLDPNTMEILSTSTTYSFELTMDSPRTYYALFNQTTSSIQPVGNLKYIFYNEAKLASVTDTTSTSLSGALEIPSVVSSGGNSYKVYSIGNNAFSSCKTLTSITIPGGVMSIGSSVFNGCTDLQAFYGPGNSYYTIDDNKALIVDGGKTFLAYAAANTKTFYSIPEGVTSIGNNAFRDCSGLTSITIPEGVTSIGEQAFSGCSGLTSISLPKILTSIGNNAFRECSSLTSITIPERVTSIDLSAFSGCTSLASVIFSGGGKIKSIQEYTFYECSSLAEFTIPETVTSIGSYAFAGCTSLSSINMPSKLTSIGTGAFRVCTKLESFTGAGNTYYRIDDNRALIIDNGRTLYAYAAANTEESYVIPSTITKIEDSSFYKCAYLRSITIADNVTSIGNDAFYNCKALTTVTFGTAGKLTSIGEYAFDGCSSLTDLVLPSGLKTINSAAFQSCTNLKSLTIPSTVKNIYSSALYSCNSLRTIVIESGSSLSNSFSILGLSGNWYKNGSKVTKFSGAGTYTKR